MGSYPVRRFLQTVLNLFAITALVFFLLRMLPGDPAWLLLGDWATQEQVEAARESWGLNKPLYEQFLIFLQKAAHGDFGLSRQYGIDALSLILERMPATFLLALSGMLFALSVSFPLGIISGLRAGGRFDNVVTAFVITVQSIPIFWLGILLILLMAVRLRFLPAFGYGTLRHLVLPSVSLGSFVIPLVVRMIRSQLIEAMSEDYIRTARMKGLKERQVVVRHAMKNALIPVITVIGLQFGFLLGGAVIIESLFSWPGVGQLLANSIFQRDFAVVQAATILLAGIWAIVNAAVDLLYVALDPRIHYV